MPAPTEKKKALNKLFSTSFRTCLLSSLNKLHLKIKSLKHFHVKIAHVYTSFVIFKTPKVFL